jgi:hypothetical protein
MKLILLIGLVLLLVLFSSQSGGLKEGYYPWWRRRLPWWRRRWGRNYWWGPTWWRYSYYPYYSYY